MDRRALFSTGLFGALAAFCRPREAKALSCGGNVDLTLLEYKVSYGDDVADVTFVAARIHDPPSKVTVSALPFNRVEAGATKFFTSGGRSYAVKPTPEQIERKAVEAAQEFLAALVGADPTKIPRNTSLERRFD